MSIYANHLFVPGTRNNSWAHLYEYINEGDRVLDVGCSTGHFGEALLQLKNCEVIGVDIDESDIKEARKRLSEAMVLDIDNTKAYPGLGKFDVIIFADVLEHLVDPRTTLQNIKNLLKPKGRVIFSIPHMAHSSVRLDLLRGKFPYKNRGLLDRTHLHFYDMDETMSIFDDSGYAVKRIDPVISKYPHGLIKQKLAGTGINPTKEIEEFFRATDGDIFQIVGYAESMTNAKAKSKSTKEYVMPQDELYKFISELQDKNNELQMQMDSLLTSTSWKVTEPLRTIAGGIYKVKKMKRTK